ncbi:MAG: phosphatidylserine decarboxylase, partial [Longimicrobiaceae bacterium]
ADLFARNERLLCYLDGPLGRMAVVAVGAYKVGRISAAFDPLWNAAPGDRRGVTNRPRTKGEVREYDPPVGVRQGDEVMAFPLGSTVVLLFEPGRVEFASGLRPGRELRLGEAIAEVQARRK